MSRAKRPLKPSEKRALDDATKLAKAREKAARPGRGSPLTPVFKMPTRNPDDGLPSAGLAYVLSRYSATQIHDALQLKAAIVSDAFADFAQAHSRVQGLLGRRRQ